MSLFDRLKQPEACAIEDFDHAGTMAVHAEIIRNKGFLHRLYSDSYHQMRIVGGYDEAGVFVEIGSGGGFIRNVMPTVITSDVVPHDGVDQVFSAEALPFADGSVNGIFILNCFHHFREPALAIGEFQRVLVDGGSIVMIEPANTWWGRLIYTNLHHEPFDPGAGWSLPNSGRLTNANGALPWIVFVRDRRVFDSRFKLLSITSVSFHTPFAYLMSGGLSWRQLGPTWTYPIVRALESLLSPFSTALGMFMTVALRKCQVENLN